MKRLFVFLFLLFGSLLIAQPNKYLVEIKDVSQVNKTTYEFNIYMQTPKAINLTSYQCVLSFKQEVINSGNITFEYISGTSQLVNKPYKCVIKEVNGEKFLAFWSMPSLEQINGTKLIGKFRLTNTVEFPKNKKLDLKFSFAKDINTIFTGTDYNDITTNFVYKPK